MQNGTPSGPVDLTSSPSPCHHTWIVPLCQMVAFDTDGSGQVSVAEFINVIRGPMSDRRFKLVQQVVEVVVVVAGVEWIGWGPVWQGGLSVLA